MSLPNILCCFWDPDFEAEGRKYVSSTLSEIDLLF
ncbi:MAG: hypothetical protein JWL77_5548 [Chthonomonadaceae bacterium]|nr:hypothetical protein [Chthonomonadaceae bacterium]